MHGSTEHEIKGRHLNTFGPQSALLIYTKINLMLQYKFPVMSDYFCLCTF